MKALLPLRRATRVGIGLGRDGLWAALLCRTRRGAWTVERSWERPLAPLDAAASDWPDLCQALAELREEWGPDSGALWIALLPPLVQVRRIELPPLREAEARSVLARDATRYFLGAADTQVVGVASIGRARGSPAPIIAAAAPAGLIDAILDAATRSDWEVASVASAHWAWLSAAKEAAPGLRDGAGYVFAEHTQCAELLCIEDGELVRVRRLPSSERGRAARRELTAGAGHIHEMAALEVPALAAGFAPRVRAPQILPDRLHQARRREARRVTYRRLAAAVALLAGAAAVELWGTQRELDAVLERRQALRAQVDRVMAEREAILAVNDRLRTLAELESTAPAWSALIAALAERLPRDAYLTAFRSRADSVVLQGVASRAVGVFEAVQKAPGVAGVRAEAPIRQELRDGGTAVERFVLAARWSSAPGGGTTTPAATAGGGAVKPKETRP